MQLLWSVFDIIILRPLQRWQIRQSTESQQAFMRLNTFQYNLCCTLDLWSDELIPMDIHRMKHEMQR